MEPTKKNIMGLGVRRKMSDFFVIGSHFEFLCNQHIHTHTESHRVTDEMKNQLRRDNDDVHAHIYKQKQILRFSFIGETHAKTDVTQRSGRELNEEGIF